MKLEAAQVEAMAPDSASVAAARKEASPARWQGLGRDERALWGHCQGSALYSVMVDTGGGGAWKCSCPSRKQPCKHVLGLMLMQAVRGVPLAAPPGPVADWLAGRDARAAKKAEKAEVDPETEARRGEERAKREEKREARMDAGVALMRAALEDLARMGLAQVSSFNDISRRMVDAQAAPLAERLDRVAERIGQGEDWPERVMGGLGRLALLCEAWSRRDGLPPALAEELRLMLGFTLREEEVLAQGERVPDRWVVRGRWVDEIDPRVKTQRTWLWGVETGRSACLLHFSVNGAPFGETLGVGAELRGSLAFWPGGQRAVFAEREPEARAAAGLGGTTIAELLSFVADQLAANPFRERWGVALKGVVPAVGAPWLLCGEGGALPLVAPAWGLLALSGGRPVEVAGEWHDGALRPLAAAVDGRVVAL